jgi:hypothetical protein
MLFGKQYTTGVKDKACTVSISAVRENENFYEWCHSFREISSIFCESFSRKLFLKSFRKPKSDEKWYKISAEKEYMKPAELGTRALTLAR